MSIATEISRIQTDRNTIRAKLVELGMATNTDNLTKLAGAVSNIDNQGTVSAEVKEGETYTIPKGYHSGSGTVSGVAGGGNYKLQSKPATPTKNQQSITPDSGYYGLSDVTVAPIPDAYQDVTSVTATAGEVLTGKVIVTTDGTVTTGAMANNGSISRTLSTTTSSIQIPAGYHNGKGTVQVVLETKTATPTEAAQDITPTSGKVLSKVTVGAIPSQYKNTSTADVVAANILEGKIAFGKDGAITGTMPKIDRVVGGGMIFLDTTTTTYPIPVGYHAGDNTVAIQPQTKEVTPSTAKQEITPTTGMVLSKVTVNPIPPGWYNTGDASADSADILAGVVAYSDLGKVTGSMPNNGATGGTIDGLTTTSYTIPGGYTTGGTVSLTNGIEEALAAI